MYKFEKITWKINCRGGANAQYVSSPNKPPQLICRLTRFDFIKPAKTVQHSLHMLMYDCIRKFSKYFWKQFLTVRV